MLCVRVFAPLGALFVPGVRKVDARVLTDGNAGKCVAEEGPFRLKCFQKPDYVKRTGNVFVNGSIFSLIYLYIYLF